MTPTELFGRLWARPAAPTCPCGAAAELGDDGATLCVACLLRRADLAAHPERFEDQVIIAALHDHQDVLDVGKVEDVVDDHMHVTWAGLVRHRVVSERLAWVWTAPWPEDDRTLEEILEVRALERLWVAGRAA